MLSYRKYDKRAAVLNNLPSPLIIAHRGASAHAPENTLAAFELAIEQGADGVELDVQLSQDGQVIVFHDLTVDRTTEGSGPLREKSLAEIRSLDAGSHFDVLYRGEPIPTLQEVFAAIGKRIFINVELANYATPTDALPEKVVELTGRYQLQGWVMFSSFHPLPLWRIRKLMPAAPVGLISGSGIPGSLARSWVGRFLVSYQSLHPILADTTQALVQDAHLHGKRVYAHTVNREQDMWRLFGMEADGFFTDDPLLARRVVDGYIQ